jgi:L-2-hydroxyglutarate oxidase LhgO
MADDLRGQGVTILTGREVSGLHERGDEVIVAMPGGELRAGLVVACAGLHADRVAALSGARDGPRIVPFRGDYYTLTPDARGLVRGLIYPVPDPRFPFLGVHFTKRIDGEVWAGPNAVLAFAREGYRRRDIRPLELLSTVTDRGFLRLASRYLRTGLGEMWRDWWKPAFVRELQRYLPEIRADQLAFGPSGVRAQALARDGTLVDDFVLGGGARILHVRNAPSPAATSSLAIGTMLATTALDRLAGA